MVRAEAPLGMAVRVAALVFGLAAATLPLPAVAADSLDDLPPGEGRELTFAFCTACHGFLIVRQQGLSRDRWEDTITFMVETKGMPKPDPEIRQTIVSYLAGAFPPRRASRQATNPFLK